jgi:uridine kinase
MGLINSMNESRLMIPKVKFMQTAKEAFFSVGLSFFLSVLVVKLLLLGFFSSGYQDALFTPFVNWFVNNEGSPWEAIYNGNLAAEFPYPPLMLYLLAPFYSVIQLLGIESVFFSNLIRGLPLIIADLVILLALVKLAQLDIRRLSLIYLTSPIILFSTFIHHQLDVIPIALFLLSLCFFVRHHFVFAGFIFGLSLATKHHVIAMLPFLIIYMYQRRLYTSIPTFLGVALGCFILLLLPYLFDNSFRTLVFSNEKQQLLFDSVFVIGGEAVFLPVFIALLIYMAFFSYRKVNQDLLLSFSVLLFTSIIFFIEPSPGWYVWIIPLLSLLVVRSSQKLEGLTILSSLSCMYLVYFIIAHEFEYVPIKLLGKELALPRTENGLLKGLIFTVFEVMLCYCAFFVYRVSVRTNAIYKKDKPFLIGVGGDSGTGKTTCNLLVNKLLKDSLLQIEGDGDHKWERGHSSWKTFTHLNPKANFLHRQAEDLYALKNWQEVKRVDYDHKNGDFTAQYSLKPKDFLLISGLHPYYLPMSRSVVDLKIYMEPDETLRRHWKVSRDTVKRGYSVEKVMEQIELRMPDARKFIYPQRKYADLIFSFYPVEEIVTFGLGGIVKQGLKVYLDASIQVENLFDALQVNVDWEYSEDMESQILIFSQEPVGVDFEKLAIGMVPSLDELVYEPEFEEGYNGLIQLLMLLCVSHKMKEER